ncbi:MAG: hypothetical protein QNK03_14205 [Myxococcota bacterium]|nr:hypothetical protein [Myxococcota bacterium]
MQAGTLPGDESARALAAEILARDEYARYRVDEAAWRAFFGRIADAFEAFQVWMSALHQTAPLVYWLVLGGLLGVAVLLLAHVVYSVRAALLAQAPEVDGRRLPGVRDFAAEGRRLASEGRFLEAARRIQLACLERLIESGALELQRADANRTLRRRVGASALPGALQRELVALVDRLEARLFRDHADDHALYRDWLSLHARLESGESVR